MRVELVVGCFFGFDFTTKQCQMECGGASFFVLFASIFFLCISFSSFSFFHFTLQSPHNKPKETKKVVNKKRLCIGPMFYLEDHTVKRIALDNFTKDTRSAEQFVQESFPGHHLVN